MARSNLSSAALGNEGLFNLGIQGSGILCLESLCPKEELVEIVLDNDELKIERQHGHRLERLPQLHRGALRQEPHRAPPASGEGLVNVYRGTGKVLLAPVTQGMV